MWPIGYSGRAVNEALRSKIYNAERDSVARRRRYPDVRDQPPRATELKPLAEQAGGPVTACVSGRRRDSAGALRYG